MTLPELRKRLGLTEGQLLKSDTGMLGDILGVVDDYALIGVLATGRVERVPITSLLANAPCKLTDQEKEVALCLAQGFNSIEKIANMTGVDEEAVEAMVAVVRDEKTYLELLEKDLDDTVEFLGEHNCGL